MSYVNDPTRHVKRFEVPEDVAIGADGEPAWVDIKTRIKGKHTRALQETFSSLAKIANIDTDNLTEDQATELVSEAQQAMEQADRVYEVYAALVMAWNWLDEETGESLPQPTAKVIEEELDQIQTAFIRKKIREIQRYQVTEGNAKSGSGS